jgi:midasin
MNPATDAGKRDLPPALRARFTEVWVDEPSDPSDLCCIVSGCLSHIPELAAGSADADDIVSRVVACYTGARALAAPLTGAALRDGSGGRPHYSVRRCVLLIGSDISQFFHRTEDLCIL